MGLVAPEAADKQKHTPSDKKPNELNRLIVFDIGIRNSLGWSVWGSMVSLPGDEATRDVPR